MIGLLKKMFGVKPAEVTAEAPYKVEVATALGEPPATVVAVEGAGTVEVTPVAAPAKKPAPKKQQFAKKPAAPKTAQPKAAPKPKTPPKPKAKPAV
jgi:hypothetical protein